MVAAHALAFRAAAPDSAGWSRDYPLASSPDASCNLTFRVSHAKMVVIHALDQKDSLDRKTCCEGSKPVHHLGHGKHSCTQFLEDIHMEAVMRTMRLMLGRW